MSLEGQALAPGAETAAVARSPSAMLPRVRLVPVALGTAAGAAATLLYSSHLYLFHLLRGGETTWRHELAEAAAHFGPWALLTPLVLAMARRRELLGPRWRRNLAWQAGAALAIAVAQLLLHSAVDHLAIHGGAGGVSGLVDATTRFFTRTFYANILLYFVLVVGANAWERGQRARSREADLQRHLLQAQLEALRLRLQPHFLFNALHGIAALIPDDPSRAQRMVTRLADLLRGVLATGSEEIPLHRELALARAYLDVEAMRFEDRLTVTVDSDPSLAEAAVPALLLQPLLENAIRHGIARRPGPGSIRVRVAREGAHLAVSVRDDGAGLPDDEPHRTGVGLGSLRSRLDRLYEGEATLSLRALPEGGAEARVELPLPGLRGGAAA